MRAMLKSWRWISFEFLALALVIVAAFCNVSVFYSFYHYLGTIGVPVAWRGFLVGLEPMAAFILRLFVLPWLHVRNALSVMMASLFLLVAVSCSYMWVATVPALDRRAHLSRRGLRTAHIGGDRARRELHPRGEKRAGVQHPQRRDDDPLRGDPAPDRGLVALCPQ